MLSKEEKLQKAKEGYNKASEKMVDENVDAFGNKLVRYLSDFIMFPLHLIDYTVIYSHGRRVVKSKVRTTSLISACSMCVSFITATVITKDYTYLIGLVLGLLIILLLKGVLK